MANKAKYSEADEMQRVINEYFENCDGEYLLDSDGDHVMDKQGRPIRINDRMPTVTGLAYWLGFTSRQALLGYEGREKFTTTLRRAKMRCEEYAERRLYDRDGQRGAEFSLRVNFGWRDNVDANQSGGIQVMINAPRPASVSAKRKDVAKKEKPYRREWWRSRDC